jgi:poly-beta-1,6-N-acetyl-D-glucosamine synthase
MQVTVGICAFNEDKNIGRLLENILNQQELSFESEVLVVCSGCTDRTVDIAQNYAKQDLRVKLAVEEERKGKASAVNYILSKAQGDAIIFISADTLPKKGCFQELIATMRNYNVGIVCGNPIPINKSDLLVGRIVQLLWRFHSHVLAELNETGIVRHATELFCIRKGIVDHMPAETVNDDAFIALTTKKKGWLIKYEPQSRVFIYGPTNFTEYFQQRRRVLYGHHQVKKLTGEAPQHLLYLIPLHPIKVIKLSLWLTKEHDILTLIAFLLTEFTANIVAINDVLIKRAHFKWNALPSTKNLPL